MSFIKAMRLFYMKEGYDYKEATRHAVADYEFWRNLLT